MKRVLIIMSLIVGMVITLPAQETSEDRKTRKEERKKEKAEQQRIAFAITKQILEDKHFILEANRLYDRYGSSISVSPMINFIAVDSSNAVIQTGNPHSMGYNGLGGITADGKITKYTMDVNEKKGSFRIKMSVTATVGMYDVEMFIDGSGNARATLFGVRGKSITYSGEIVPTAKSIVFEGTQSFF